MHASEVLQFFQEPDDATGSRHRRQSVEISQILTCCAYAYIAAMFVS